MANNFCREIHSAIFTGMQAIDIALVAKTKAQDWNCSDCPLAVRGWRARYKWLRLCLQGLWNYVYNLWNR